MLQEYLHLLDNTGEAGFEGVIKKLLTELSGFEFRLSRTGSQYGRDARAQASTSGSVMFECKNYRKTEFDERKLMAELDQAIGDDNLLDIWILAASRPIPDQLATQLGKKAIRNNVDFLGLDCGASQAESLDYLCSAYPHVLLNALNDKKIDATVVADAKQAMIDITNSPGFTRRVENLRRQLTEPTLGWPVWRSLSESTFLASLSDEQSSRASFGQLLNTLDPNAHAVSRKDAKADLDKWWHNWSKHNNLFVMLGEEGDGKTWSVTQWLASHTETDKHFPPVVFISSTDAKGAGTLDEIVLRRLEKDFGVHDWKARLNRWRTSTGSHGEGPIAIIVLDGLNERQTPDFWRSVIDSALAKCWKESVALICTARSGYWNEFFKPLQHLKPAVHTIASYDDDELREALSLRKQNLIDFPTGLHALLRKPRYLDLAVKYRERLKECGDFTIARLIYEDWRDRYQRKTSCPMSEDQFNDLLTSLGKDFLSGQALWNPQEISERLALTDDKVAAFRELSTGGIIIRSGGAFKIQSGPLALGLGMLLCSQLESNETSKTNLQEIIASWIEPYSGVELQSQVLELAALHSLMQTHSSPVRIALLVAWLGTQNPTTVLEESVIRRFTAYLPENTDTYFDLAERVWSEGCDNPWAQEILLRGFIDWAHNSSHVLKSLPTRLTRWLGMVPIKGLPTFRRGEKSEEKVEKISAQLFKTFGKSVNLGLVNLDGYDLIMIDDDGWLRLARVALAIISTFDDRTPFLPQICTAMLSDSIHDGDFNYPEKMDLLKWILRSSTVDLSNDLLVLADQLLRKDAPACKRAAGRLFTSIGTKPGWEKWQALDQDEIFPTPEWVKREQQKPFDSLFAVSTADLEAYTEAPDFKPWNFLTKIGNRKTQRNFTPRGDVTSLLLPVFDRFDGKSLWVESGQSPEESFLDQFEPVLARYCSSRLCNLIRSNFMKAIDRSVSDNEGQTDSATEHLKSLLYLRFEINKYDLLLRRSERERICHSWRLNRDSLLKSDIDHEYTETLLFQTILPIWNGQQQLTELLARGHNGFDLASYIQSFEATESIALTFDEPKSTLDWTRLCIFLASTEQPLLAKHQVAYCLQSDDADLRAAALRYLYAAKSDYATVQLLVDGDWQWQPATTFVELEYGAALLIEYGKHLTTIDLLDRVPPTRRGVALLQRSPDQQQIQSYAEWIDKQLSNMLTFEMPNDFPSIEIDYYEEIPSSPYPVSVIHDEESQSIHFVSPESVWGGRMSADPPDFERDHDKINAIWKERYETLKRVTEQGASAGHHWVSNIFHADCLPEAILAEPGLPRSWIDKATNTNAWFRARSFYQSLCEVLFRLPTHHNDAVALYRALSTDRALTNVVAPNLELSHLDVALFGSNSTPEIEQLWMEKLDSCASDRDLLNLALAIRSTPKSQAYSWFKTRLQTEIEKEIPFYKARAYALLGFLEEDVSSSWLSQNIPDDTYWLQDVQRKAQQRFANEGDCRFWFSKFCTDLDLDDAWCSYRLFLACVDRRCWLWLGSEVQKASICSDKARFLDLNHNAISRACKENEKKLDETFLRCKVDMNLRPWLRFPTF